MGKNFDYSQVTIDSNADFSAVNKLIGDMFIVDQSNLEGAAAENSRIFTVLQNLYSVHTRKLKKLYNDVKKVEMARTRHYQGKMPAEHYKKDPLPEAVLKSEVDKYVAVDPVVVEIKGLYADTEMTVTLIEEAKKMLNQRGWDIRAIIDLRKMQSGQA